MRCCICCTRTMTSLMLSHRSKFAAAAAALTSFLLVCSCRSVAIGDYNDDGNSSFASNNGPGKIRRIVNENAKHNQFSPHFMGKIDFSHQHIDYGEDDEFDNERILQFVSGRRPYEPIRIKFDTRVIESRKGQSDELDAKIDAVLNNILPAASDKWAQHLSVQPVRSPFFVGPLACQGQYAEYLQEDSSFSNADLVVIVAGELAGGNCDGKVLAFARPCSLDQSDRPIVGAITFCLDGTPKDGYLVGDLPDIAGVDLATFYGPWTGATFRATHVGLSLLEITVHEMGHILGLSSTLFPYYRDENGAPRTNRSEIGVAVDSERQCINGTIIVDSNPSNVTVQVVQVDDGRLEQYLVTPRVQAVARNHFNCQTLLGGRLQDDEYCFGTHWHERHSFGELMGPIITPGSPSALSVLTLALMEDTGWYQVDYRGAGQLGFGLGAGCEFVTKGCIDRATGQAPDWVENEFCASPFILDGLIPSAKSLNSVFCDPAYQSWAICDLSGLRSLSPGERTYFPDATLSTILFPVADNCPIPLYTLGLDCRIDDPYNAFYAGESVGNNSRCINAFYDSEIGPAYQPACMQITCDTDAGVVRVGQGELEQSCTYDGELLPVSGRQGAFFVCPRLAAVCPEIFACPDGCFGRGECVYPVNGTATPPFCRCFNISNTDKSCAPSYITEQLSNVPSNGQPSAAPSVPVETATSVPSARPSQLSPTTSPLTSRPSATETTPQTRAPTAPFRPPSTNAQPQTTNAQPPNTNAQPPPTTSGVLQPSLVSSLVVLYSVTALLLISIVWQL